MIRSFFLVGSTVFWITMMSRLIQTEFFELRPIQASYEVLPFHAFGIRDDFHALYLGEKRIGFNYTALDPLSVTDEKLRKGAAPQDEAFELRHQSYLSFLLLGKENKMIAKGKAKLNDKLQLKHFVVKIMTKEYWNEIEGQVSEHQVNLLIKGKDTEPVRKIVPVKGPVFYSESVDYLWTDENLQLGKQGHLQVWNPLLLNVEDISFRVAGKEWIPYEDRIVETYVIFVGKGNLELRTWVTPEGLVLRKESPTGLLLKREPGWEIFDAMREKGVSPPDLPHLYSIPSNQILENPGRLKRLKVKLKTPEEEKTVEVIQQDFSTLARESLPVKVSDPEISLYLQSNEFIQADDPEIQARSKEILGTETDVLKAGLKIMSWVHGYVNPSPTISLPSAKQVLTAKSGDCNEYTALFTAISRAAGIPTRMVAGLVYQNGRFFYHAWAEIYVGGSWVGLDPTFNQAPVDATHIPIVTGNLKEQIDLLAKIGRIKVLVMDSK